MPKPKIYKAVLFDLFGTLVPVFSMQAHNETVQEMAKILGASPNDFEASWGEGTYTQRSNGTFKSIEENLIYVCAQLGIAVDTQRIQHAANARYAFTQQALKPKEEAVELLGRLRREGIHVGLITNCAPDVPKLWGTTLLSNLIDKAVFSCQVGIKKPDERIYHLACEQLRVLPGECLYVGDGSDRELTGAKRAGLSPVLVVTSLADAYDTQRIDVNAWEGRIIESLQEITELV